MNFIISERQYKLITEQLNPYSVSYDNYSKLSDAVKELRKKPHFDTLGAIGLWYVPFIGPYLSSTYSSLSAIEKIKQGNQVEGIIELITSPLVLVKTIKFLGLLDNTDDMVRTLQTINKIGVPLLVAQGQEAFLKWGYKTLGKEKFDMFLEFINNEKQMKKLLLQLKK